MTADLRTTAEALQVPTSTLEAVLKEAAATWLDGATYRVEMRRGDDRHRALLLDPDGAVAAASGWRPTRADALEHLLACLGGTTT